MNLKVSSALTTVRISPLTAISDIPEPLSSVKDALPPSISYTISYLTLSPSNAKVPLKPSFASFVKVADLSAPLFAVNHLSRVTSATTSQERL